MFWLGDFAVTMSSIAETCIQMQYGNNVPEAPIAIFWGMPFDALWSSMIFPHVSSFFLLEMWFIILLPTLMLASETSKHVEDDRRLWQKLAVKLVSYKDEWCIMVLLLFVFVDITCILDVFLWEPCLRNVTQIWFCVVQFPCLKTSYVCFFSVFWSAMHRNPLQLGDQHGWSHRSTHSLLWRCWQCSNWALCILTWCVCFTWYSVQIHCIVMLFHFG